MNIPKALFVVPFVVMTASVSQAATIHPAITAIKDWLLYRTGANDPTNGMRRSVTYSSATHNFATATKVREQVNTSTTAETLRFLSEYYLQYQQNEMDSTQRAGFYVRIREHAEMLLRFRRYGTGQWGYNMWPPGDPQPTPAPDFSDGNLQAGKVFTGAFASNKDFPIFAAVANAYAVEGLLAAARVADLRGDTTNRDKWRATAKVTGDFLLFMSNAGPHYWTNHGIQIESFTDGSGNPVFKPGMVASSVSVNEVLDSECRLWGMRLIVALKELGETLGGPAGQPYLDRAEEIKNRMTPGLLAFNNSFFPKVTLNGSNKVSINEYDDDGWHPRKDVKLSGAVVHLVGDDQIEVAFGALWKYEELELGNTEFTYVDEAGATQTFDVADRLAMFHNAPVKEQYGNPLYWLTYDPYVAFTGMITEQAGVFKHNLPYYDMIGFGLLSEVHLGVLPSSYQQAWSRVVRDRTLAGKQEDLTLTMCTPDLEAYWSSGNQSSKSSLVAASIGISLIRLTPYHGNWPIP